MTSGTLMYSAPYYDENGVYHHEDPNVYTTEYECSLGHIFEVKSGQGMEDKVRIINDKDRERFKISSVGLNSSRTFTSDQGLNITG